MRLPLLLALAALGLVSPARAGLTWAQKTQTLKADANSQVIEARYHFTNSGAKAVDIQQVESSCGCTTAELEKRHYEPGESGDIVARFTIGMRVGRQTKTIAVRSNDRAEPDTLTMIVDIPELVRIRPVYVFWMQGDAPKPKTMTLEVQPESPVEKIDVAITNPLMTYELKEVVKGVRYDLSVTPAATGKVAFCMLTLECKFAKGETKSFRTYATIKPADPK